MKDEAQQKARRAKRVPAIAATKDTSQPLSNAEEAFSETLSIYDIMRMESYPGEEDGELPQLQNEEAAARSMEVVLNGDATDVQNTFISVQEENTKAKEPADIVIPTEAETAIAEGDPLERAFPPVASEVAEEDEDPSDDQEAEKAPIPLPREGKIALIATAAAFVLALLSVGLTLLQNDTVNAYEVSIGGKELGYVEDKQAVAQDYSELLKQNQNVEARDLSFASAAVPASSVLTDEEQTALLYTIATEGYVRGYTVTVDGEAVAYALSEEEITGAIDTLYSIRLNATDAELLSGGTLKCANEIAWEYGYVKESEIADESTLISLLDEKGRISYVIERTVTAPKILRYTTEFRDNDEGFDGITTMISAGKNGIAHEEYLQTVDPYSGELLTSELQKTTVIEEPVNAVSYYGQFPLLDESVCTDSFIFPLAQPEDNTWVIGTQVMSVPKIYLSSGYGARTLWGEYDFHLGYDIAAPRGTEILACDGGIVVDAGYTDSYGYFVRIKHRNGVETMYAHMSKRIAEEGEYVTQGQVIGLVGATGMTSGNHLHLEFRHEHVTCDPADYIELPDWVLLEKDKDTYN